MAGYLPRSELELFRSRPGSNQPGVFPPTALLGQEKIVYEARPALRALSPVLFWVGIALLVFFSLIALVGMSSEGVDASGIGALIFLEVLAAIPLLIAVSRWWRTSYAITDQRVVAQRGDTFDSVPLTRVRWVRLGRASSTVVFELIPDANDPRPHTLGPKSPMLEWQGVFGAPGVATYANSAVRYFQIQQRQKQLRDAYVSTALEDRVLCEYCGLMIPVAELSVDNPKCPRCSAPVLVAPLGV